MNPFTYCPCFQLNSYYWTEGHTSKANKLRIDQVASIQTRERAAEFI